MTVKHTTLQGKDIKSLELAEFESSGNTRLFIHHTDGATSTGRLRERDAKKLKEEIGIKEEW